MGKRPAASKATRGVSRARVNIPSSSSNPKTRKFRSQYNSLAVIAKGGPSKKAQNKEAKQKLSKEVSERQKLLSRLDSINMDMSDDEQSGKEKAKKKPKKKNGDNGSEVSRFTTASFASTWSNCTNASLSEFFQVWNPELESHKEALAVIAGLSQIISSSDTEQSDLDYTKKIFSILASPDATINVLTGALLALTFVMRKLSPTVMNEHFDSFYPTLKDLMERYHNCKRKTVVKCLLRCFSSITKVHPQGKEAIESGLRKKINIAIRQQKVQSKIQL